MPPVPGFLPRQAGAARTARAEVPLFTPSVGASAAVFTGALFGGPLRAARVAGVLFMPAGVAISGFALRG